MFLVGIYADSGVMPSVAVIIEFSMKTLKKRYQVREIRHWTNQNDAVIDTDIASIHADSRYTVMRRVFSQDRRPARNVPTPPTLVMHFRKPDSDRIDRLRERNIPVEGVAIRQTGTWQKEDYKTICLGNNYRVAGADIRAAVAKVVRENRLGIDENLSPSTRLAGILNRMETVSLAGEEANSPDGSDLNAGGQRHMLLALSLPIWFRETIRQIRRY